MTKKVGSSGRFGVRYGRSIRRKVAEIERKQKNWQQCPYCNANRVKRIFLGVWNCKKCNSTFTGKAYEI